MLPIEEGGDPGETTETSGLFVWLSWVATISLGEEPVAAGAIESEKRICLDPTAIYDIVFTPSKDIIEKF